MKKVIYLLSVPLFLLTTFMVSIDTNAHCYLCNGGDVAGYCKGNKIKACVDDGNWWDNRCDLDPKCASLPEG